MLRSECCSLYSHFVSGQKAGIWSCGFQKWERGTVSLGVTGVLPADRNSALTEREVGLRVGKGFCRTRPQTTLVGFRGHSRVAWRPMGHLPVTSAKGRRVPSAQGAPVCGVPSGTCMQWGLLTAENFKTNPSHKRSPFCYHHRPAVLTYVVKYP